VRTLVDLERADLDALRALAKRRGVAVAALIRRAIAQYLGRAGRA
jgi:predicted DNA-binding ribbon-helix-helix protein